MNDFEPMVELGMQELEPMDALGWWTGFQEGVKITIATLVFSAATAAAT